MLYLIIAIWLLYELCLWILRRFKIKDYGSRYVLITGCDTGFGHELAQKLDKIGFQVYATCYTEQGTIDLKGKCSKNVTTLQMDVSKDESVSVVLNVVKSKLSAGGLWGLINNAGVWGPCLPLDLIPMERVYDTININLYGMIRVTKAFLPLLRKARGRVINTSGIAGNLGISPVPYVVSKYGVEGFSDRLRCELYHSGVSVCILKPGPFKTPIIARTDMIAEDNLRLFKAADDENRDFYGEAYIEKFNNFLKTTFLSSQSEETWRVIWAYTHALTARYPKYRYLVGPEANLFYRLLFKCPEWIQDRVCVRLMLPIKPAGAVNVR